MVEGKTKAAIAISVASLCGEAALQLSDYHSVPLSIALTIIAVCALAYAIWHGVSDRRENRGTTRLRVQPAYLIYAGLIGGAFCLLMAAGGYWWERSAAATAFNPLSPTQEQFRLELRKFVLSPLDDLRINFSKVIWPLINEEGGTTKFFATEAIQSGFFYPFDELRKIADQQVDYINSDELQKSIVQFLTDYNRSQGYLATLAKSRGISPDNIPSVGPWIELTNSVCVPSEILRRHLWLIS
jgi:hypothetical protein